MIAFVARRAPVDVTVHARTPRVVGVGRGCGCASDDLAARVMGELGMEHAAAMHASPDRDWSPDDWRAHIDEEHRILFPALLVAGEGDPTTAGIVARLEGDHAVYLDRLSRGLELPHGSEAYSVDVHGNVEDGLVRQHAGALRAARSSAGVGEMIMVSKDYTSSMALEKTAHASSSWWPWIVGTTLGAGAWAVGLGPLGIALTAASGAGGAYVVEKSAKRASTPLLLVAAGDAIDQEADEIYDYVNAYWTAYESGVGGKPAPGVDGAVAAIDAAAASIDADIQARIAKGQANQEAFLGAVGFFFGSSGRAMFEKVIGFAHWLEGSDKGCADPALRDEAKACADAYATYGAPIYLVSDRYAEWSLTNYCQLRGQYCGMRDDFLLQTPVAQEALRAVTSTMLAKAKTPAVARILRFSLGAFVTDGPDHLVPAVKAANAIPHPRGGQGMDQAWWFVAVAQLAAAQHGGDARTVMRAAYRETKDRAWQYGHEFPNAVLSRLKGYIARWYDYGGKDHEHHMANVPGGDTAIRAQWARVAYLAAQGTNVRGVLDALIIPMGAEIGEPAEGGIPMGE